MATRKPGSRSHRTPARNRGAKTVRLEDNVAVRIMRLSEVLARLAKIGVTDRWGLSSADMRILNLLDGAEGVSVSELARRAHYDKAWISRSLIPLQKKGLVARRDHDSDTRAIVVTLTPRARAVLDEMRPLVVAGEKLLLAGVNGKTLKRSLDQLLANAEAMLKG